MARGRKRSRDFPIVYSGHDVRSAFVCVDATGHNMAGGQDESDTLARLFVEKLSKLVVHRVMVSDQVKVVNDHHTIVEIRQHGCQGGTQLVYVSLVAPGQMRLKGHEADMTDDVVEAAQGLFPSINRYSEEIAVL